MSEPFQGIDFQSPAHAWAVQMACDELNAHAEHVLFRPSDVSLSPGIKALTLRIIRTENKPVDPDLIRARRLLAAEMDGAGESKVLCGYYDHTPWFRATLAALKEGRGS